MEKSASQFDIMALEPYIRVEPLVLEVLGYFGIDINEAGAHFVEVVDKMRACPPNYRFRKESKNNIWIVRDYFPGTPYMYKVTMVYQTAQQRADYENKIRDRYKVRYEDVEPYKASDFVDALWVNVKFIKSGIERHTRIRIPYHAGQEYSKKKIANILIGDDIKPEGFMPYRVKPMKRMFPKGYKVENCPNKRPTHLSHERKKRS